MQLYLHTQIGFTTVSIILGKIQTNSSSKKTMAIKVSMTELLLFEPAVWRSHHQVLSFIILWRKGALFISYLELLVVPT